MYRWTSNNYQLVIMRAKAGQTGNLECQLVEKEAVSSSMQNWS